MVSKTAEFEPFLRGPALRTESSRELNWKGFVVEKHIAEPGERPETTSDRHIIVVWSAPAIGEHINGRGVYTAYTKPPGSLTLVSPGIVPAVNPRNRCETIACSLDPAFVNSIKDELDQRPLEIVHYRTGFHDRILGQLMALLQTELEQGGLLGRLYSDHLTHALSMRLLFLNGAEEQSVQSRISPLPRLALRRVLDRMQDISADVDLETLAAESGYSRRHFLRMFQAATGCTPHRYRMRLKLKRACELIKHGRTSLTDIALDCGFSSHSHMSNLFREVLRVTPTDYRRNL